MKTGFLLLCLAAFAPGAWAAYRCVDEKGLTHVGDTPPAACANVVIYETNRNGHVVRKIEPTPSAEEVRRRAEEAARRKAAERMAAEQKRKDTALLNTFSSEREFDVVRDRTIEPINGRIRVARERLEAIAKRDKALDDEMEFYREGKSKAAAGTAARVPANLVQEKERLGEERKRLNGAIAASEREIAELRERFDEDKKRWVAIKANLGRAAPAKSVEVVPAGGTQPIRGY